MDAARLSGTHNITSCAQVGSPGTIADDGKTPFIISMFGSDGWELANPGNWQLKVFHDGNLAFKRILKQSVPSVGYFNSSGCNKHDSDVQTFEYGWKPGSYRFRYTCSFDTSRVVENVVTVVSSVGLDTSPVRKMRQGERCDQFDCEEGLVCSSLTCQR